MLVLLISNPAEKVTSCALSVATGSHNDPKEILGLAHFCEHMILSAGSKSYPDLNAYHNVISKNGGSQNAFTTGEQTTFCFELPNLSNSDELVFDKVLDIFSSSFKKPLFNELLVNKEIYAINSEHTANKSSRDKIFYHATRLLANGDHPFSQFSTGDITTLSDMLQLNKVDLRTEVMKYFKNNFYAENMCLCIKGPQSLNTLAKLVFSKFNDIKGLPTSRPLRTKNQPWPKPKSRNFSNDGFGLGLESFKMISRNWSQKYGNVGIFTGCDNHNTVLVDSQKLPALRLIFPIHHRLTRLTKKEIDLLSQCWCELFGDESEGSLCHFMKKNDYITELTAFMSHFAANDNALILELYLTNTGWKNLQRIVAVFFNKYVPIVIECGTYELAEFLSELNCIELLKFLYQDVTLSSMEECSNLSSLLLTDIESLGPSFILKGSPMNDCNEIDSQLGSFAESEESRMWWIGHAIKFQSFIKEFINFENVRLVLMGDLKQCPLMKTDLTSLKLNIEPYYEFEYHKCRSDQANFKLTVEEISYSFHIPYKNVFLPFVGFNLSLIKNALLASSNRSQTAALSLGSQNVNPHVLPRLLGKNCFYEMWVKEEDFELTFKSKSVVTFEIISTHLNPAPSYTMMLEILCELLGDMLSSQLYPSEKIGYTYEIAASSKGDVRICFTVSGFSEGVYKIIEKIVGTLVQIVYSEVMIAKDLFRKSRIAVRNKYEEAASVNSTTLANIGLLIVLEKYMWRLESRLEALESIDMESFKQFLSDFFGNSTYMNLFIQGDQTYTDQINTFLDRNLTGHLSKKRDAVKILNEPTSTILKPGSNLFITHKGFKDDPNNSIVYFIQTGDRTDNYSYTLTAFTAFLISLTLVPDLRGRKQVGYIVLGGLRTLSSTVGLHITITSSSPPHFLEEKIDEYLSYLEKDLLDNLKPQLFREKYVKKYLNVILSGKMEKTERELAPVNLMSRIKANVRSGNLDRVGRTMKSHRRIRAQISSKRYNFEDEDEPIDLQLIESLDFVHYMQFFKQKISIYSSLRSKISVMVSSPMSRSEIYNRKVFLQLESFLKLKGFKISGEQLQKIVRKSDGKPTVLMKELFQYFASRGESLKISIVMLKEITRQLSSSLKNLGARKSPNFERQNGSPTVPLTEIVDPDAYF